MSREQFFKPVVQEKPQVEELVIPEKPTDWEIIKTQHLAAKDAFYKARAEANRTGKEKYIDNKYRGQSTNVEKPSM